MDINHLLKGLILQVSPALTFFLGQEISTRPFQLVTGRRWAGTVPWRCTPGRATEGSSCGVCHRLRETDMTDMTCLWEILAKIDLQKNYLYTWIFQVCKICAFSPKKPTKRQKIYISRRSRYKGFLMIYLVLNP